MTRLPLITVFGALLPTVAAAQSFDGAYISLERFSYSSEFDGETDFYGSSIGSVGGEFGLGVGFGISADLTNYGGDINNSSGTLHAFYRFGQETAIGAFYGFDALRIGGFDDFGFNALNRSGTFYGAEARTGFASGSIEGFVSESEGDVFEGTTYGIDGEYRFGRWGLTASYSALEDSDSVFDVDRIALGGVWNYNEGVSVWTELGRSTSTSTFDDPFEGSSTFEVSEDFISVGIRIGIGPNNGTTFGPRSHREILY